MIHGLRTLATSALVVTTGVVAALALASPAAASPTGKSANDDTVSITTYQGVLPGLHTVTIPDFRCPPNHPWLDATDRSNPQQRVPRGVQVNASSMVDVSITGTTTDASSRIVGWSGYNQATNWNASQASALSITAYCTSDPGQASAQ